MNWKSMLQRPQFWPTSVEDDRKGVSLCKTTLQNSLRSLVMAMYGDSTSFLPLRLIRFVMVLATPCITVAA